MFVLTSNYESYPTVINEALILNVPVVSHDIPSAHEMLTTGKASDIENLADANAAGTVAEPLADAKMLAGGDEVERMAEGIVVAQNGLITDVEHMADAIVAALSLTVDFFDENEEVRKRLEGELTVVR